VSDIFVNVGPDTSSTIILPPAQVENFLAAKSIMGPDDGRDVEVAVYIEDEGSKCSPASSQELSDGIYGETLEFIYEIPGI